MKFILDSGIKSTIITEMTGVDTVDLSLAREITLDGLGEGEPLKAWYSEKNEIRIIDPLLGGRGIMGDDLEIYVIPENLFEFSKQFGLQINGLIGADFFSHFVLELNYSDKLITFHKREKFNFRKANKRYCRIPLIIENQRPYIEVVVIQEDGSAVDVKLLIDTGASMAIWLSLYSDKRIVLPETTYNALLGQGLNGDISGLNGRIKELQLGQYRINRPIVAYPDSLPIAGMAREKERNGTLGNEILKRFTVIFDYEGNQCFIKPNKNIRDPFNYNRSGLEIEKPFYNLPVYQIYDVVPGSPADLAGVKAGDQIEMINYLKAFNIELDQINSILYGTEGKTVRLRLLRDGELFKAKFTLDSKL